MKNDDSFDIEKLAEENLKEQERAARRRKKSPAGKQRSLVAWANLKSRLMEEEKWRQQVSKAFSSRKKPS